MATAVLTIAQVHPDLVTFSWPLTTANADGAPIDEKIWGEFSERTVHGFGTWGSGTLAIQGSSDPAATAYANLATGITADGHINLVNVGVPLKSRPNLTGSTGATVTVVMVARRPRRAVAR